MRAKEFTGLLNQLRLSYSETGSEITVTHQGSVDLSSLTSLPDGVKFENQGGVYLGGLTSLPDGVKFENRGVVYLGGLTSLPDGVKFENQGGVYLSSLTSLPDGVKFENQGGVYLSSLTSLPQVYMGKTRKFQIIDGYTMLLTSSKRKGELTISRAVFFGGGPIDKLRKCFIAQRGEYFSHGETAEKAIRDVTFKILQSTADLSEVVEQVKESGVVTVFQYRLLTGACQAGCEHFMESEGIPMDTESLPLDAVLAMTAGAYGGKKMQALFGKGAL